MRLPQCDSPTCLFLLPSTLLQRLGNDPLQLAVDGAELIGGPFLHRLHRLWVDAEQEGLGAIVFLFRHDAYLSNASPKVIEQRFSLEMNLS